MCSTLIDMSSHFHLIRTCCYSVNICYPICQRGTHEKRQGFSLLFDNSWISKRIALFYFRKAVQKKLSRCLARRGFNWSFLETMHSGRKLVLGMEKLTPNYPWKLTLFLVHVACLSKKVVKIVVKKYLIANYFLKSG